jgi:hypothetical protein
VCRRRLHQLIAFRPPIGIIAQSPQSLDHPNCSIGRNHRVAAFRPAPGNFFD